MKLSTLACLVLVLPLSAFSASGAVYKATTPAPAELQTLVIDWATAHISEEHSRRGTEVELGSANKLIAGRYDVLSVVRSWETHADVFTAEKVLASKWDAGCGEGYEVKATVVAKQFYYTSEPIQNNLKITVKISETNDTCHSDPSIQKIEYKLVKKSQ